MRLPFGSIASNRNRFVGTDFFRAIAVPMFDRLVHADFFLAIAADGDVFVDPDFFRTVIVDGNLFIVTDMFSSVVAYFGGFVVFHNIVLILLGVDVQFFAALLYPRTGSRCSWLRPRPVLDRV